MMLSAIAIALMLQAQPSSLSGVVVQNGNNTPIANVRVSLARTDAALGAFAQMVAGDRPPGDLTLPGEFLAMMTEMQSQNNVSPEESAQMKAMAALGLANISELLVSARGEVAVVYKSHPPVQTDSQGRFSFNNVEPGTYKLIFAGSGFARQDYGQRGPGGAGIPIVLGPAMVRNDIVMRMSQVSALGGRILDPGGRPAAGVPVQLFRFAYDETGKRTVQRVAAAQSDDRGIYRIFSLSPGRYYLSAGSSPNSNSAIDEIIFLGGGTPVPQTNRIPEKYAVSYYPGAPELNSATAIEVSPGADIAGVDMYLKLQQTFRVRGVVLDPSSGQPPRAANISLNLQNPDPMGNSYVEFGDSQSQPIYRPADGTFELRNVPSGAYTVTAELPNTNQRSVNVAGMSQEEQRVYFESMNSEAASRPRAFASINVTNADLDNVQLRIGASGSVTGSFRAESAANVAPPELVFLRVQLRQPDGSTSNASQSRQTKVDGTFRIDGIWPGEYVLAIGGLPTGYYIKEARLGELDLLNNHWNFSGSESAALNIVISSSSAQVEGSVADALGQAVAGARVVLIPERNRERPELFRPVVSDPSGHFRITGIAPGDYKLVAWDAIEPFAFFEADLLKQADDGGKLVRVGESSTQAINVVSFAGR